MVSKPVAEVYAEFKAGLGSGYERFKLIADDCGSYGQDIGIHIGALLKELSLIKDRYTLDIHYIHPHAFLQYFDDIKVAVRGGKIRHINIPFQSGSQRILSLMNRNYGLTELAGRITELKKLAKINLATDIIVGFPTESRAEFYQSLEFSKVYDTAELFFYTPRPATKASMVARGITSQELAFRRKVLKQLEVEFPRKYRFTKRGALKRLKASKGLQHSVRSKRQ